MRVIGFLVRNWPLKLGAVALAVILYVAMVSIQATQNWPGQVPIEPLNQPASSFLLRPSPWPKVSDIRYIAPADVRISQASFRATVDLTGVKVGAGDNSLVKVQLVAEDARIQIVDYQPQQIRVTLDPIISKEVPVKVVKDVPEGLNTGTQTLSAATVTATGASSQVARVSSARAEVRVDASGLDVNEDAALVPIDSAGNSVDNITLSPASIHVQIQVGSQTRTATVPVAPVIVDSPAAGYYITAVDITPPTVLVSGQANALSLLNGVAQTQPISIKGATGDVTVPVALALPNGVVPDVATVKVTVHLQSPVSTRTYTIGIVAQGARADRAYTFSTANLEVTLGGATASLNAFDASSFTATVSVAGLDVGTHVVTVSVNPPAGLRLVSASLTQVTVTVSLVAPSPSPS
jgi:YbbR domain-containing protein